MPDCLVLQTRYKWSPPLSLVLSRVRPLSWPARTLVWHKDGQPISTDIRMNFSENNVTLAFSSMLPSHGGYYECVVTHGALMVSSQGYLQSCKFTSLWMCFYTNGCYSNDCYSGKIFYLHCNFYRSKKDQGTWQISMIFSSTWSDLKSCLHYMRWNITNSNT